MSLGGQWRVIRHYLSLTNLNAEMEKLLQRVKTSAAAAAHTDSLIRRLEKAVAVRLMHDGKAVEVHKNGAVKMASTEQAEANEALQVDKRAPEQVAEPREPPEPPVEQISELSIAGLLAGLRRRTDLHFGHIPQPTWKTHKPVVTKTAIQSRTAYVVSALAHATSAGCVARRTADLRQHLADYPDASQPAVKEGAVRVLLRVRERVAHDAEVVGLVDEVLAAVGWAGPPRGRRACVLALDGGGVRGLLALHTLRAVERAAGRPARELFDLIVGVSTGAIIAAALAAGAELEAAAALYRRLSRDMFASQSRLGGGARLVWTHAYYDTRAWERLLREQLGDVTLQACSRAAPRLALVSTVVCGAARAPFLFRSYCAGGRYRGTSRGLLWHAVRASAAAPTYFDEFALDGLVHQDGGIMVNNPAGVALHEARALWGPGATLVSVGTGRAPPRPAGPPGGPAGTSWRDKFDAILESATDTEGVHRMLADILPPETYFRFNPPLLAPCAMDEVDPDKIQAMMDDGAAYIRRNQPKIDLAAARLTRPRPALQRAADWLHKQAVLRGLARTRSR